MSALKIDHIGVNVKAFFHLLYKNVLTIVVVMINVSGSIRLLS